MIIALAITFAFMYFIIKVCHKTECYDLVDIYKRTFGKVVGNILLILYYITIFLTLIESTSIEATAMQYNFMLFNPVWMFLLLSVIAGLYSVILGLRSVMTTVSLGIIFISSSGILLATLVQKYKDFTRLFPIFEYGITTDFLICIIKLIASLSSLMILVPLFEDVKDKHSLLRMSILGFAFSAQIHIVSITGTLTTFEPVVANTYPFPKLTQTERILHFGFLEAGELFVMLQIIGGWMVKFVISFFVLNQIFKRVGAKKNGPAIVVAVIVYGLSYLVGMNLFDLFSYINIYVYISLLNFFIIPIVTFGVFLIRNKSFREKPRHIQNQQLTQNADLIK